MENLNFKSSSNGSGDCAYLQMDSLILHKGHVVHVIDPSSFWMRIGMDADFKEFDDYQKTLNKFYNEMGRKDNVSVDTLAQGDCVVVADTSCSQISVDDDEDENRIDFHWNRARVSRMDADKVDVLYIDLGYTEIVDISRVKNVNKQLFDYIPSQAFHLGIAGIKPLARSWTSRAVNMFSSKVLDQEVLVCLIDYDEVSMYGQVVIYIQYDSCRWRSLTHAMLDEDLGLPSEPKIDEFLSQEEVLAALARVDQDSSLNSCGPDSSRSENAEVSLNETESRENLFVAKPGQSVSSLEPGQHLQPDRISTPIPPHNFSSSCENAAAQVPAFDLSSLVRTRSLSLSKMQEDKFEEQRLLTRAKLEQELEDNEEDDNGEQEIDWGKSDLCIGEAGAFSDFDNIRQEIYKHHFDHSDENNFHEFFYNTTQIQGENPLAKFSFVEEQNDKENTPGDCSEKQDLKPLTEMEDYEIQKKIKEILTGKDGGEMNMVCVLINSIVEPDLTIPCDRLIAVFTAILETMVHNSDIDPLIALGALETYLGTSAFETAITTVLKSLRCSCVKLPQTKRNSNSHRAFTELLVTLFICAGNWPPSTCLLIQEFVLASLERWVVFNKQRAQNSDSCTDVEMLYLECVGVFFDSAGEMLRQRFPERFCSLIDDIKHKLLHDSTQRIIREQLLNILLKAQAQVPLSTQKSGSVTRDMGAQTEPSSDYPGGKDIEDSGQMHSAVDEDMNTIDDVDCRELVGSRFHSSGGSNTSCSWYDESCDDDDDDDDEEESLDNADTLSDTHSLKIADMISGANSVDYVAGCNTSGYYSKPSASATVSIPIHSAVTVGNSTETEVSAHLQREHFSDHSFQEDITAGDTSDDIQQMTSEEFNASAAEFTCSVSQSFPKQEGHEQAQSGCRLETQATKGKRHVNNSQPHDVTVNSKPRDVTAEKQDKEYKLNVSAPEFTPKLSSSWAKLGQTRVSLSPLDGYRADLGAISVVPSGRSNSDLTKPFQCDMENENDVEEDLTRPVQCDMESENGVEEDSLFVGFGKEGIDQQIGTSGSNNETYATVSDSEKASEYHSPPPLGITNQENISSHSSEKTVRHVGKISQEIISSSPVKVVGSIGIINQGDIIGPPSPKKAVGSVEIISQGDDLGPPLTKETVGFEGLINQSSIFGSPSPEKAVKSVGVINQRDIIKYTAQELKALNIGTTSAHLIDVSVTGESSAADHIIKTAENQADQKESDVKSSPSAVPYRRYAGKGDSPLEISFGPKSNSAKWKSLSELLPPSNLKSGQFAVESSLHPQPINCESSVAIPHASESVNPNSLHSIAQSLFSTKDQPISENDYMGCDESSAFPNALAGDSSGREVNSCERAEARIIPGLSDAGHAAVPEWPEALFRNVASAEDNTQPTSAPNKTGKRKAKKKIKFRPASEVLAEKSGDNSDENKMPMSDVDYEGCRIEAEVEDNEVGGHVIHQPKLGALCSSSSKRSSWLTEVKQERPRADKWVPGKRKCTRCGSTDHTIYDCPQEDPFQRPSNQAYFL